MKVLLRKRLDGPPRASQNGRMPDGAAANGERPWEPPAESVVAESPDAGWVTFVPRETQEVLDRYASVLFRDSTGVVRSPPEDPRSWQAAVSSSFAGLQPDTDLSAEDRRRVAICQQALSSW